MKRIECTEIIIDTIREKGIKYQELADGINRSLIWTTLALQGQATMDKVEAAKITEILGYIFRPKVGQDSDHSRPRFRSKVGQDLLSLFRSI